MEDEPGVGAAFADAAVDDPATGYSPGRKPPDLRPGEPWPKEVSERVTPSASDHVVQTDGTDGAAEADAPDAADATNAVHAANAGHARGTTDVGDAGEHSRAPDHGGTHGDTGAAHYAGAADDARGCRGAGAANDGHAANRRGAAHDRRALRSPGVADYGRILHRRDMFRHPASLGESPSAGFFSVWPVMTWGALGCCDMLHLRTY